LLFTLRAAGAIGLCLGIVAIALGIFIPAYRTKLEELGGGLMVGSLALLGVTFAMV
jgi:hypothetical protein